MNNYYEYLIERKSELLKAISKAEQVIERTPSGNLRVANTKSGAHYFHVLTKGDNIGKYIPKTNQRLISDLANRNYCEQLIKRATSEVRNIDRLLEKDTIGKPEELYSEIIPARRQFINPLLVTDDEYITIWKSRPYRTNPYRTEDKIHETNCGEYVRSKSERDIANILDSLGIPYRYEAELVLGRGQVRYPDFTLLDIRTREEIYYEHFGLMDDSGYRRENLQKINEYCENGIILGKNLIFTFEAQGSPLNLKNVKRMLREFMGL